MTSARHPAVTVSAHILLWAVCLAVWGLSSLLFIDTVFRWQRCGSVFADDVAVDLAASSLLSACAALRWHFWVRSFVPPTYYAIQMLILLSLVDGAGKLGMFAMLLSDPMIDPVAEFWASCGITSFVALSRVSIIFLPLLSAALGAVVYAKPHRARLLLIINGVFLAAAPLLVAIVAP
ncbi:hypothetical protein [Rathayibacter tritici]|uniref:hypothetical protein n=1 Tax=Rathayibacter tritici TaxID=33888 RepID=UPI00082DDD95|nr:hypothetical protein [Rathayibacter tritici]PPI46445.1 hypothetical protein C5D18_04980 [Rathayibacter tritici]